MMHRGKDNLKNISFDFAGEEHYKNKVMAQIKLE